MDNVDYGVSNATEFFVNTSLHNTVKIQHIALDGEQLKCFIHLFCKKFGIPPAEPQNAVDVFYALGSYTHYLQNSNKPFTVEMFFLWFDTEYIADIYYWT